MLSRDEIQIVTDSDALSRIAADIIVRQSTGTLKKKNFFAIALSGGSTPKTLYTLLSTNSSYRSLMQWDKIHFFWTDERHVPPDHKNSNYHMAKELMLSQVPVPNENIHRIKAENSKAANAAEQYEQEIRSVFNLKTDQLPQFDCILLGMGTDGHTASLFPVTTALNEQKRLVVANWIEKFQAHRLTMTIPVLINAEFIIFLVSGEEKAEMLKRVLEGERNVTPLPAQLIQPKQGKLLWIVDKAAASRLSLYT
jgi:6-phosphogluconolactonase